MLLCLLQALGVALKLTFQGQNQLAYLQFYVFLGVRVCRFCLCLRPCGHYEPDSDSAAAWLQAVLYCAVALPLCVRLGTHAYL